MDKKINNPLPLACDLTAIGATQREHHQSNTEQLLAAVQVTQELPEGYAFRFSAEPNLIIEIAEFIKLERLCCPFFNVVRTNRRLVDASPIFHLVEFAGADCARSRQRDSDSDTSDACHPGEQ